MKKMSKFSKIVLGITLVVVIALFGLYVYYRTQVQTVVQKEQNIPKDLYPEGKRPEPIEVFETELETPAATTEGQEVSLP
jgi:cell division protein FtsL